MTSALLFAATVLIWGTTWIAIKHQLDAPALTAVFWRFVLAAGVTLAGLAAAGRLTLPRRRDLAWLAGLGGCIFSTNFVLFYHASRDIPSGLVSVIFATATLFNAVNARIFYGDPVTPRTILATLLGAGGLAFLFGPEIAAGLGAQAGVAVLWGLGGTLSFSLGNMIARRNSRAGLPVLWANGWGMAFGAGLLGLAVAIGGTGFATPQSVPFVSALLYLSLAGSVVAFACYLSLVARIGPSRAAYSTVLFPVVALTISWLFEGYAWTWASVLGLGLVLAGNVAMFSAPPAPRLNARGSG